MRKLADELIKRQLEPKKEEIPAAKEDEIDYYDDPKKAVHKAIEEHPAVKEAKQQALEMKKMQMLNRLASEFPDFHQTANDPEFAEWLKASPVRLRLYAEADGSGDYDAAAELLSTWNYVKPKAAPKAAAPSQEIKAAQKAAVKQATVDVGSNATSPTSSKIYRRADLIRLRLEDPDKAKGPARDILFVNEANLISKALFDQLLIRTTGQSFLDWNPADFISWVYEVADNPQNKRIHSTYLNNISNLSDSQIRNIEQYKDLPDDFMWKVYGLGERGSAKEIIYTQWKQYEQAPDGDGCRRGRWTRCWSEVGP